MASNNWSEWQNHVLAELTRLNDAVERVEKMNDEDHRELFSNLATLKVKARVWGALAGAIPGMGLLVVLLIRYFLGN